MGNTALLVIDMQTALMDGAWEGEQLVARLKTLIANARTAGTPVVYMQHENEAYPPMRAGADTWQVYPPIAPEPGDIVLRKRASDSFYQTELDAELRARDIAHLVVTGMQTEYCVDTTVRAASSHGYDVTLVADGHTTSANESLTAAQTIAYHNTVLAYLAQPDQQIEVVPAAEISFGERRTERIEQRSRGRQEKGEHP